MVNMHEGSNIHYSPIDNKLLCSYSVKLCRQRRLNGWGFCVRHILEDPAAPFRQCAHVSRHNKQQCTNAIPKTEPREYCNNHLIMMGLIEKKEKKPKQTQQNSKVQQSQNKQPTQQAQPQCDIGHLTGKSSPVPYDPTADLNNRIAATLERAKKLQLAQQNGATRLVPSNHLAAAKLAQIPMALNRKLNDTSPTLGENNKFSMPMNQNHVKTKLSLDIGAKPGDAFDDPYAFPDEPGSPPVKNSPQSSKSSSPVKHSPSVKTSPSGKVSSTPPILNDMSPFLASMGSRSVMPPSPQSRIPWSPGAGGISVQTRIPNNTRSPVPPTTPERLISAAKLYPELAEKLYSERSNKLVKPVDAKAKGGLKSSRTMNALETKIAQNKIKDKMKRQENSLSGSELQSPMSVSPTSSSPKTLPAYSPQPRNGIGSSMYSLDNSLGGASFYSSSNGPLYSAGGSLYSAAGSLYSGCGPYSSSGPLHVGLSAHTLMAAGRQSPPLPPSPPATMTTRPPPPYRHQKQQQQQRQHQQAPPSVVHVAAPSTKPTRTITTKCPPYQESTSEKIQRLLRPKNVMNERQAKSKFGDRTAVDLYGFYVRRRMHSHDLAANGVESSDTSDDSDAELLPWQRVWFSPSSDEEPDSDDSDDDLAIQRTTRHALMKTRLRRQFLQTRRNQRSNLTVHHVHQRVSESLVETTSRSTDLALRVLASMTCQPLNDKHTQSISPRSIDQRPLRRCLADQSGSCERPALPFANHCRKHIMYNVDQKLFDYCTGRNLDGTQCCDPVFNIKYDFPLCAKHAVVALRQAAEVTQIKRPRKKTKPSALTRPPKRGKKKRVQRYQPMIHSLDADSMEENDDAGPEPMDVQEADDGTTTSSMVPPMTSHSNLTNTTLAQPTSLPGMAHVDALVQPMSPVPLNPVEKIAKDLAKFDRQLSTGARPYGNDPFGQDLTNSFATVSAMNLEQATRLLEEHDINEVLNKLPDEAFDIFSGKNGDYIPTHEETEELERALAVVSETVYRTKHTLDQMGFIDDPVADDDDDEITKQIADQIFQQNLVTDHLNNGVLSNDDHLQDLANSISDHDLKSMFGNDLDSKIGLDPRTANLDLFSAFSNGTPEPFRISRSEPSTSHAISYGTSSSHATSFINNTPSTSQMTHNSALTSHVTSYSAPSTSSQPIEWMSTLGLPSLLPPLPTFMNGHQTNGLVSQLPEKIANTELAAILAGTSAATLFPSLRVQAPLQTTAPSNGEQLQHLVYQLAVSLPLTQTLPSKET